MFIVEKNEKIQILRQIVSLGLFQMGKMTLDQKNRTFKSQQVVTDKTLAQTPLKNKE